jgi:hypothetical protein
MYLIPCTLPQELNFSLPRTEEQTKYDSTFQVLSLTPLTFTIDISRPFYFPYIERKMAIGRCNITSSSIIHEAGKLMSKLLT